MTIMYHYCDLNAFLSIISNKRLWLSSARNMNDYMEISWFMDKFETKLISEIEQSLANEFIKFIRINNPTPYICSFSKNGDLLSQWRAYASDGSGISIGFESTCFGIRHTIPFPNNDISYVIGIAEVLYDTIKQDSFINQAISKLKSSEIKDPSKKKGLFYEALKIINGMACISKNPAFSEENELRIIHTPLIERDDSNFKMISNISNIKHRVSCNRLTSLF